MFADDSLFSLIRVTVEELNGVNKFRKNLEKNWGLINERMDGWRIIPTAHFLHIPFPTTTSTNKI
jgi:hypothetical protein